MVVCLVHGTSLGTVPFPNWLSGFLTHEIWEKSLLTEGRIGWVEGCNASAAVEVNTAALDMRNTEMPLTIYSDYAKCS